MSAKRQSIQYEHVAAAVRQVASAVTSFHGADCHLYAHIGAALLNSLGYPVRVVAGSAIWRVGDGDSDVVSHAREIEGPQYSQAGTSGLNAAIFHAWIEGPGAVIDFSTFTLRRKAQQLDAVDGGHTEVTWCPDFIWESSTAIRPAVRSGKAQKTPRSVLMAPKAGVFNYTRHPDIESVVLKWNFDLEEALLSTTFAVKAVYAALCEGRSINVIGLAEDGSHQEEPSEAPLQRLLPN